MPTPREKASHRANVHQHIREVMQMEALVDSAEDLTVG